MNHDDYDRGRLGGTAGASAATPRDAHLSTINRPVAVHVFNEKVVIVASDGVVTELDRA